MVMDIRNDTYVTPTKGFSLNEEDAQTFDNAADAERFRIHVDALYGWLGGLVILETDD